MKTTFRCVSLTVLPAIFAVIPYLPNLLAYPVYTPSTVAQISPSSDGIWTRHEGRQVPTIDVPTLTPRANLPPPTGHWPDRLFFTPNIGGDPRARLQVFGHRHQDGTLEQRQEVIQYLHLHLLPQINDNRWACPQQAIAPGVLMIFDNVGLRSPEAAHTLTTAQLVAVVERMIQIIIVDGLRGFTAELIYFVPQSTALITAAFQMIVHPHPTMLQVPVSSNTTDVGRVIMSY